MPTREQAGGGAEEASPPAVHERLLRATVDVVSTLGYEATRVEQIVEASGLSRSAFYRHFGGKRGAVLAAGRRILDDLALAVRTALAEDPDGRGHESPDRVAVGLTALARALAGDLPATAVLVLEVPAIGADAAPLRDELRALIETVLGARPGLPAWSPAGAVLEVLHRRIADGHAPDLPALVPGLLTVLATLVPAAAVPGGHPASP